MPQPTRRQFIAGIGAVAAASLFGSRVRAARISNPGATHHVYVARHGTPVTNVQRAIALAGGIQAFVDYDDAVVLKPNGQWARQGYTHTECLKALIDVILDRPGGFSGEIIIAEHVHRTPAQVASGYYRICGAKALDFSRGMKRRAAAGSTVYCISRTLVLYFLSDMAKKQTDSFVCEMPLRTTSTQEKHLLTRLEAARQVYNACLGESLKRLRLKRQSKTYQSARKMPKGKVRMLAFRDANAAVGFREYDLHAYAKQFNHCWIGEHLDSSTIQKLARVRSRLCSNTALADEAVPASRAITRWTPLRARVIRVASAGASLASSGWASAFRQ